MALQTVMTREFPATKMELDSSFGTRPVGAHASSMTWYLEDGHHTIEWDIPGLDRTVHLGLWFEKKVLVDYDGNFTLPIEAIQMIRDKGYTVPKDFEP